MVDDLGGVAVTLVRRRGGGGHDRNRASWPSIARQRDNASGPLPPGTDVIRRACLAALEYLTPPILQE